MRITIESTDKIVELQIKGQRVEARLWEGKTDGGVPVACFITMISPQTHDADAIAIALFDRELREMKKPTIEPYAHGIDLRLILP